ncbi:transposase [Micromonospora sp. NPDC049460]|uniref:IS110 family transposase n=1 Tax=Micromonospora sp. NPDC049460 TaxID=3364272 RepID=UPI0037B168B8
MLDTGGTRKTDAADAASVAHAAMRHQRLRQVVAEDHHTRLRLLSERRDDLARERVRLLNRLHVLLRDLIPGGAALDLTADKAAVLLRTTRPLTATDSCRRDLARELIADLRHLDRPAHQPGPDPAGPERDALHHHRNPRRRAHHRREDPRPVSDPYQGEFFRDVVVGELVKIVLPIVVLVWLATAHRLWCAWPTLLTAATSYGALSAALWYVLYAAAHRI